MDDFLELQSTFLGELLMEFHEAKKKKQVRK